MTATLRWRRRLFRFSLSGLLLLTLATCVYLGSHRVGERAGAQQQYDESFFTKTYNIGDLLIEAETSAQRARAFAAVIASIRSTVSPQSWTAPGEHTCEIVEFPSSASLIVSQYGKAHDQIPLVLKDIRRRQLQESTAQALDEIEKLEQDSASRPAVLVSYPAKNDAQFHGAIANRFADLTEELSANWGAPTFAGQCTDQGFPAWSAARSLATWSRDDGELYLAIQYSPGVGEAVVAGWQLGD
jgi:hypothetical protein